MYCTAGLMNSPTACALLDAVGMHERKSVLARSDKLPTVLYILPSVISFFFKWRQKLSQDPLDRFSRSLHQMIRNFGISLNTTDLDLFFDSSRDVAMATN